MVKTSLFCLSLALVAAVAFGQNSKFTATDCTKSVEEGPMHCMASIKVFTWDHDAKQCVEQIYGGCHPTANNFKTKENCEEIAQPVCAN